MRIADQMADEIYGLHCDIGRLERDNAELKKLAGGFWQALKGEHDCPLVVCEYMDICDGTNCNYEQHMRALGVKVDE